MLKQGKGAFAVPAGGITVDNPDGVSRVFGDEVRNSLYDARFVEAAYNGCGYGAFPDEGSGFGIQPMGYDDESNGAVTGASSDKPVGHQR